jgi:Bacteriophage probable baseplate hub protein
MITQTNIGNYAPGFKIAIGGAEMDPVAAHSILSLKVEQELNKTNAFSFEVQDEFDAGQFKWLEADIFRLGDAVSVAMGYANGLVKLLDGKIKNINASFHTGCAPIFTVEGSDSAYDFLTTPSDTELFREKRDSDIVKKIANAAGLTPEVDPTESVTAVKVKQGGKSYLEFLRRIADENHYEFFLGGRRLHFKKDAYKDSVTAFSWGKDLIRFEPQLNTSMAVTEVIVRGWDPASKKQIEGRATAGDEDTHEGEKRTSSQITKTLFGDVVRVITDRPVRSVDEAKQIALSELNRVSNNLIQATLHTIGIPELTPGTCVDIDGFGRLFSGKYYVVKTTHSIGSDGYRSSLTVQRNAI